MLCHSSYDFSFEIYVTDFLVPASPPCDWLGIFQYTCQQTKSALTKQPCLSCGLSQLISHQICVKSWNKSKVHNACHYHIKKSNYIRSTHSMEGLCKYPFSWSWWGFNHSRKSFQCYLRNEDWSQQTKHCRAFELRNSERFLMNFMMRKLTREIEINN